MLTHRPWYIALTTLLSLTGCDSIRAPREILNTRNPQGHSPRIIVQKDRCDLLVPVATKGTPWKWGGSSDSVCEYSIQFVVDTGNDTYHLGFSYFSGARFVQSGTLDKLISVGQNDVWQVTSDSGSTIGSMEAVLNGSILEISMTDRSLIERVFGSRPARAILETAGTRLVSHQIPVEIEYRSEDKNR